MLGPRGSGGSVGRPDAGSVHGGEDGGTVTSKLSTASRSIARLRRFLASDDNKLLPGLWWLRAVGIMLLVVAITLAIGSSVLARSSFDTMGNNLDYIGLGAQRLILKAKAIFSMQDLIFHGTGWLPLAPAAETARRSWLAGNASTFLDVHLQMAQLARADSYAVRTALSCWLVERGAYHHHLITPPPPPPHPPCRRCRTRRGTSPCSTSL